MNNASFESAVGDIHILAYTYHWSRESLWDMSRSERRLWVKMVRMQKTAEANAMNPKGAKSSPSTYREGDK